MCVSIPANVFQSVFSFQVFDVLSNSWPDAILLGQMPLKPLNYCLIIIPKVSLEKHENMSLNLWTVMHGIYNDLLMVCDPQPKKKKKNLY